ncbi:MAG: ABC transporter permease [Lachnospiraceae bacterium]|nr:ABC transporter permease [Lachnospiraceae bacterium]
MKQDIIRAGELIIKCIGSIFLLSILVFSISRLAPGDPLRSYYGDRVEKMSLEERELAEEKLGLRESIPIQYVRWLAGAIHGDFGISYKYKMDVKEVIAMRFGNTLLLGGLGFVLIFVLALLLGLLCAWKEEKAIDRMICTIGTVTSCIPEFWLSLLLILLFAVCLGWLPSAGAYTIGRENDPGDRVRHLILPLTVVVLGHLWYYAYLLRNRLLEEVRQDYVLLARMKGLSGMQVLCRHCLRNALPSYLSMMAIALPHILGGTYVVETVFSYPGIGTLVYESARFKDYNLLMLLSLLTGALVIFCNMLAQVLNERLDPRIRTERRVGTEEVQRW